MYSVHLIPLAFISWDIDIVTVRLFFIGLTPSCDSTLIIFLRIFINQILQYLFLGCWLVPRSSSLYQHWFYHIAHNINFYRFFRISIRLKERRRLSLRLLYTDLFLTFWSVVEVIVEVRHFHISNIGNYLPAT